MATAVGDYTKRSGKFRHAYGVDPKPEMQFTEIPSPLTSGEGSYVRCGGKYFCFASSSPGKLFFRSLENPGRWDQSAPSINLSCMKGKIWDYDFNPFIDNMVAMGDDTGKIGIATIPDAGLKANLTEATVDLGQVHGKKVLLLEFHPSASSILASAAFDKTVKICNIETSSEVYKFDQIGDNIYSMKWNENGSLIAITSKDKKLRIFDPRTCENTESVQVTQSFDGGKSSKLFWIPRLGWIGATGFTKDAKRQLKFWDLKDLSKPIFTNKLDNASSVLMPHYDNDNGVLYMAGKGEGSVQFGEIVNDGKKYYPDSSYRNTVPQKGGAWVPKRSLDVWKCEVQRFLKLTKNAVQPISIVVPRKAGADVFQDDIYPDCVSSLPSMKAEEYTGGENKECNRMQMDPALRKEVGQGGTFVKKKTYNELQSENEALRKEVAELKARLGISDDTGNDNNDNDDQKDDTEATMATDDSAAAAATDDTAATTGGDDAAADDA